MEYIKNPTLEQRRAVEAKLSATKRAEIEGFVEAIAPVISDYVQKAIDQVCKPLRDRLAALEARPELKYLGVWKQDKVYGAGGFITDSGSLWHAQRASVGERPGTGDAWVLAAKKGKDAR